MTRTALAVIAAATILSESNALASDHYFFFREDSKRGGGPLLEVGAFESTGVTVEEFGNAGGFTTIELTPSPLPFASLDLSSVQPLKHSQWYLGRAIATTPVATMAVVRYANDVVVFPPIQQTAATRFIIPVGDLSDGASLIIGNPGGDPLIVFVAWANSITQVLVPATSVVELPLSVSNTTYEVFSEGVAGTQLPFVAGLAVNTEKGGNQLTMLAPPQ
jgi:hypothetical protein